MGELTEGKKKKEKEAAIEEPQSAKLKKLSFFPCCSLRSLPLSAFPSGTQRRASVLSRCRERKKKTSPLLH